MQVHVAYQICVVGRDAVQLVMDRDMQMPCVIVMDGKKLGDTYSIICDISL